MDRFIVSFLCDLNRVIIILKSNMDRFIEICIYLSFGITLVLKSNMDRFIASEREYRRPTDKGFKIQYG